MEEVKNPRQFILADGPPDGGPVESCPTDPFRRLCRILFPYSIENGKGLREEIPAIVDWIQRQCMVFVVKRLPFVISIPHCSAKVPAALRNTLDLTDEEMMRIRGYGNFRDFRFPAVRATLCAQWSRVIVDLNRDPDGRDRKGVVPQVDYHGRVVYRPGCVPDEKEIRFRIENYYLPYHNRFERMP